MPRRCRIHPRFLIIFLSIASGTISANESNNQPVEQVVGHFKEEAFSKSNAKILQNTTQNDVELNRSENIGRSLVNYYTEESHKEEREDHKEEKTAGQHDAFKKRAKPFKNIFMGIYKNYKSTYLGNRTSLDYKENLKNRIAATVGEQFVFTSEKRTKLQNKQDNKKEKNYSDSLLTNNQKDIRTEKLPELTRGNNKAKAREEDEEEDDEEDEKEYDDKEGEEYDENEEHVENVTLREEIDSIGEKQDHPPVLIDTKDLKKSIDPHELERASEDPVSSKLYSQLENGSANPFNAHNPLITSKDYLKVRNSQNPFQSFTQSTNQTSRIPSTHFNQSSGLNSVAETESYFMHLIAKMLKRKHSRKSKLRKRLKKIRPPAGDDDPLIDAKNQKYRYKVGPGFNMSLDMNNDIVNVKLDGAALHEIIAGHWLDDTTEEGRGKKYDMMTKVLPLFILPFLIQSAIVPFLVTKLKLLLIKSILVGKLAIFLLIISVLRNSNKMTQSYEVAPSYWAGEPSRRSEFPASASSAPYGSYRVEGKPATWIN